ncbi:hypothetical protein [Luteimonas aquatica]|uniref:hypothetical protein n=1 Tax=Luteimonas aquatica TaxID=450364 RepID=UPI001F598EF2|nr:hypothetical protein [Luteimonas aquatica]
MKRFLPFFAACLLALAACAKPLPAERQDYVGIWTGLRGAEEMTLAIDAGGMVSYKRERPGMSKSLNAPLKTFEGDDFVVGLGPMTTRFKVSQPPRQGAQGWTMVVDGVELRRKE